MRGAAAERLFSPLLQTEEDAHDFKVFVHPAYNLKPWLEERGHEKPKSWLHRPVSSEGQIQPFLFLASKDNDNASNSGFAFPPVTVRALIPLNEIIICVTSL